MILFHDLSPPDHNGFCSLAVSVDYTKKVDFVVPEFCTIPLVRITRPSNSNTTIEG
jgi:hypothetical protein